MREEFARYAGTARRGSPLIRLMRHQGGNTLVLVAAAFIPLTAMIGSGIDVGRAYMAKQRMQNACDAAALAGRRVMNGAEDGSELARKEAIRFFKFNFPKGAYQTLTYDLRVSDSQKDGTVRVTAETRIPTAVMRIFGFSSLPLKVACEASQKLVNTDIVLVLDVTGSMNDPIPGSATRKIDDLREAVMALYDVLAPLQKSLAERGLRLRYGILPYSSAVNVGKLIYDTNPDYIVNQWTYQSRVPVNSGGGAPAFVYWRHEPNAIDTSQFKTFASTPIPTATPGTSPTAQWRGCIEERDTVNTIDANSGLGIPKGAYDLDINGIPDQRDATKWRPLWPHVEYWRNTEAAEDYDGRDADHTEQKSDDWVMTKRWACPTRAAALQVWGDRQDFETYIKGLGVSGNTYHDIGMIWGARLISPRGIFAANNPDMYHSNPVDRHIIFMTDGIIAPQKDYYTSYGIEELDQRVSGKRNPSQTELEERHEKRFRIACQATKQMDISIWVVGFAQALTPALIECASSPEQASTAANRDQLIEKFQEIGSKIGALRVSG